MIQPEVIENLLRGGLADAEVRVGGDGEHFQALVISPAFEGVSRIARHRMVYQALRAELESEALHAISMRTLTPQEHEQEQKAG